MFNRLIRIFGGDPNKREIDRLSETVAQINALESQYESLSNEALRACTDGFRRRLAKGESLGDILPEAFAVVREASKRTIGLRHYDVQLIGGMTLHAGKIAEMRTGEGKTLVATLPVYINALALNPAWVERATGTWGDNPDRWQFTALDGLPASRGVHLITVNDYLARRDARWMAPIYDLLGLSIGVLQMASRTENGKKAFLVDLERESPHEDQHQLNLVPRREAYAADIVYGTNSEFGFDYLRDNMAMRLADRVQRGHYYAIIDEVDNVLIDEARTPLIISGPSHDDSEWYVKMAAIVRQLNPEDYEVSEKDRGISLTEVGEVHVEELLGVALRDPERPEDVTPEQARLLGYLEQALRAQHLFHRNKEYLVQGGKVVIVDEFTGRLMPGRRWSDGLHQAVEAKEGVRVQPENVTYATITIQNYFRMYEKLSGMTGTALTEAEEFSKIYNLDVLPIPTNLEFSAASKNAELVTVEAKDTDGYKYTYYAFKDDPQQQARYYKRKDYPDVVYRTQEAKLRAIMQEILISHVLGRPVLVGTTSVELSERISGRLRADPLRRLTQVLLLRDAWFTKNNREEDGRMIDELAFLSVPLENLQVAEMRKLGRDLDMQLSTEDSANIERLLRVLGIGGGYATRLKDALAGGISHEVLNARKHTEESQIIAGAGAFGAVTIATNMAGRGVDIKLGGELAEEVLAAVNRVLRKTGIQNPYDLTMLERKAALEKLPAEDYGIYNVEIDYFFKHLEEMEQVKALGGLHVIGSERHESRRIDNQLRGRAARQGDPGSSRFYLSMEDDLMRLFGGEQADGMLRRLRVDENVPLEMGLVSRIIEQAQTRVEGYNFDARKHLLEYDDVLNAQRGRIYSQRDRIFLKEDLSDDLESMLIEEIERRVPNAMEDDEGPWKLLAWLDGVQPNILIGNQAAYPSFTYKLILDQIANHSLLREDVEADLLDVARRSLLAERNHLLKITDSILTSNREQLRAVLSERLDTLETFFDGLNDTGEEGETGPRTTKQIIEEVTALARVSLRLSKDQERQINREPDTLRPIVLQEVRASLTNQAIRRLLGAVERRLEEPLEIKVDDLSADDWEELAERVLTTLQTTLDRRIEQLTGDGGAIGRELANALEKAPAQLTRSHVLSLLLQMPQGTRTLFDRRTHRRIQQRTTRLNYTYFAATLLDNSPADDLTTRVLNHLQGALDTMRLAWGNTEFTRLANLSPAELQPRVRQAMQQAFGDPAYFEHQSTPLINLPATLKSQAGTTLGRLALTEVYRELLLRVISELWIEYITQMEALRVAIALEAYGQRDPLVQYKGRASQLFQELMNNIRTGVVNRMFTFRPRETATAQATAQAAVQGALREAAPVNGDEGDATEAADAGDEGEEEAETEATGQDGTGDRSGRRRRRRKR